MFLLPHSHLEGFCCRGEAFTNPAIRVYVLEEMMQALKLKCLFFFLCYFIRIQPARPVSVDPGQGLHLLGGAAEISCSQRNEASSKKSVPGSGRERYCFALHPSYFSNCTEVVSKPMPCHGSGLRISWTGSGKWAKKSHELLLPHPGSCSQETWTPQIVLLGGMLSCPSVIEMHYPDPSSLANFPGKQVAG